MAKTTTAMVTSTTPRVFVVITHSNKPASQPVEQEQRLVLLVVGAIALSLPRARLAMEKTTIVMEK